MKTTIRDVAQLAGVSETTVSLAFRCHSRISPATRDKVLNAARQLHYVANEAARNLRHGGLHALGVLVTDITNPFYAGMVRTVETTAQAQGYQVLVMESQWDSDKEQEAINRMLQARVQGIIICQTEKNYRAWSPMEAAGIPYIALDNFPLHYSGPYVANDMITAGKLAAEHLSDAGCMNPVLAMPGVGANDSSGFSSFIRLQEGFQQIMRQRQIPCGPERIVPAGLSIADGLSVLPLILQRCPKVDGILCANDLCAWGVMEAMDHKGLRVGADIAVMGIDDLPFSQLARISLTSIQQPYHAISKLATAALLDAIETGKAISIRETMPPLLIPRNSTKRQQL